MPAKLVIHGRRAFEYGNLLEQARSLSVADDVTFAGSVPQDKLVEAYNALDVFLLASDCEGFGFPILEAQSQ
ncbi:MAG: glycosyltransferase [Halobacteriota archaeon]